MVEPKGALLTWAALETHEGCLDAAGRAWSGWGAVGGRGRRRRGCRRASRSPCRRARKVSVKAPVKVSVKPAMAGAKDTRGVWACSDIGATRRVERGSGTPRCATEFVWGLVWQKASKVSGCRGRGARQAGRSAPALLRGHHAPLCLDFPKRAPDQPCVVCFFPFFRDGIPHAPHACAHSRPREGAARSRQGSRSPQLCRLASPEMSSALAACLCVWAVTTGDGGKGAE